MARVAVRFVGGKMDGQLVVLPNLPDVYTVELSPAGLARYGEDKYGEDKIGEFIKLPTEDCHLVRHREEIFYVEADLMRMSVEMKTNPLPTEAER